MYKITAIANYERVSKQIAELFAKKQDIFFDKFVGSAASFNEMYLFDLSDIIHDLKTNQPKGLIIEWHINRNKAHRTQHISYSSYTNGVRYF